MKHIYKRRLFSLVITAILVQAGGVKAGNPDRAGQAGATELLINPWARSSGMGGANSGSAHGLEAQFLNVAGTAFTKGTEAIFCHTNYLQGSGMGINAFGVTQKVGEAGVLGLSLMSLSFGDIQVKTTEIPEPGQAYYTPQYINMGISYAKVFSNSIYGGMTLRIISESISNVGASGLALDAGIQYVTGTNEDRDNIKFGIALRNVGTPLEFSGDGLSTRVAAPNTNGVYELSVEQRTQGFEMPSLVNIGLTYDFTLATDHKLGVSGTFTSNSFTNDQFALGSEYRFRNMFMFRIGFTYEKDIFDSDLRTTWNTGPFAGVTVDLPFGKSGKSFGIDYSFRDTNPWDGTHSLGLRFTL